MAINRVNLVGELAITRGDTYDRWQPMLLGDWRLWAGRLEIRTTYLDDAGELLASADFSPAEYDADTNLTTFKPYLTPVKTLAIPPTPFQSGFSQPSGKNCWVFDWQVELDGVIYTPVGGFVEVRKEVTQNV